MSTKLARYVKSTTCHILYACTLIAVWVGSGTCSQPPRLQTTRISHYTIEYPSSRPRLGSAIAAILQQSTPLPALPAQAPAFGRPIRIVVADSDAHFDSITSGAIPEWGAGVANPQAGIIVIPGYSGGRATNSNMRSVLRHELAHIALHRYLEPARIPRWFNEGYATWAAGDLDVEAGWRLRIAFATNNAPPLDSLELEWPTATNDAQLAYLISASVIEYLVRESGEAALASFLERWRTTQNMEAALAQTYHVSVDQLETYWRKDVRSRYGWFAVLTQTAAFMSLATLILITLFAIRRRRDRKKLAALKAAELPDQPAFWDENYSPIDEDDENTQN